MRSDRYKNRTRLPKENPIDKIRLCGKKCGKIEKSASYPHERGGKKVENIKNRHIFDNKTTNTAESKRISYCG